MSEGAAVSVKELRKIYSSRKASVPALDGVTFDVERGTIVGLLGPNGAGKTTLVKTLLALHQPTSGACEVLGREPDDHSNRRRIGYLPEQLKIPDYYKPQTFLRDMAALNGFRPSDLEARILRLIEIVGLSEALKKRVGDFSKGMQQRLGLAQALLHDPELLLLDEPTDGLDPIGRKEVRDLLLNLRSAGKTIFLNSHLLSEIELICDDLIVMKNGKIARKGKPSDFTRATGEYRIRLEGSDSIAKKASTFFVGSRSHDSDLFIQPRDVRDLNRIIDRIRAEAFEIEEVEPIHSTMEEAFLLIVSPEGKT